MFQDDVLVIRKVAEVEKNVVNWSFRIDDVVNFSNKSPSSSLLLVISFRQISITPTKTKGESQAVGSFFDFPEDESADDEVSPSDGTSYIIQPPPESLSLEIRTDVYLNTTPEVGIKFRDEMSLEVKICIKKKKGGVEKWKKHHLSGVMHPKSPSLDHWNEADSKRMVIQIKQALFEGSLLENLEIQKAIEVLERKQEFVWVEKAIFKENIFIGDTQVRFESSKSRITFTNDPYRRYRCLSYCIEKAPPPQLREYAISILGGKLIEDTQSERKNTNRNMLEKEKLVCLGKLKPQGYPEFLLSLNNTSKL